MVAKPYQLITTHKLQIVLNLLLQVLFKLHYHSNLLDLTLYVHVIRLAYINQDLMAQFALCVTFFAVIPMVTWVPSLVFIIITLCVAVLAGTRHFNAVMSSINPIDFDACSATKGYRELLLSEIRSFSRF